MTEEKKRNWFLRIVDNYNPKIIKKRLGVVRASPYRALKFQYQLSLVIIIAVCAIIVWQITRLVWTTFSRSTSMMSMVSGGVMILVGVLIVVKAFGVLKPLKIAISHYEKTPSTQGTVHTDIIDISKEVDNILSKYDKDKEDKRGEK